MWQRRTLGNKLAPIRIRNFVLTFFELTRIFVFETARKRTLYEISNSFENNLVFNIDSPSEEKISGQYFSAKRLHQCNNDMGTHRTRLCRTGSSNLKTETE